MKLLADGEGTKFPLSRVLRERALVLLRSWEEDKEIPYAALNAALEADVVHDRRARQAVLTAGEILLREDRRGVENVRSIGYRIYRADEHRRVAKTREQHGLRRFRKAAEILTATALDSLSPSEVALVLTDQARVAITLAVHKKLTRQRTLPAKSDIEVPKGSALVAMFTKSQAR
jgi:hypothetical protein